MTNTATASTKTLRDLIHANLEAGHDVATVANRYGLTTSDDFDGYGHAVPGYRVIVLPGWYADDGNAAIECPTAETGAEAAQEYVDSGDWRWDDDEPKTMWIHVNAWQRGLGVDENGEVVEVEANQESHTIALDPEVPECERDSRGDVSDHDWQTPRAIVGGLEENPGCWGKGGGIVQEEVCTRCGLTRITDTWAQNPETGEQGLLSVAYDADRYVDEVSTWMDGRIMRVAKECAKEAIEQGILSDHLDPGAPVEVDDVEPADGDWDALESELGRAPTDEEQETFQDAYCEVLEEAQEND